MDLSRTKHQPGSRNQRRCRHEPNEDVHRVGWEGLSEETESGPPVYRKIDLLGIYSIPSLIGSIKLVNFYEMDERDIIFTVVTDLMELNKSRIKEAREEREYTVYDAVKAYGAYLGR